MHGPKTEELDIVLKELIIEGGEKVVIFSQWLLMAELVEGVINKNGIGYACLHGGVPSKQRKDLMSKFKDDPACKVFLSTDAGGVGLNLQMKQPPEFGKNYLKIPLPDKDVMQQAFSALGNFFAKAMQRD